ncbi:MAG: VanZ family protein [Gammaproteobacteria bacterium]|nr:VanZ family protein [Gammaproteobacteria bacterium]
MLPLRYARRWWAASILLLLFVLAATMMPAVWLWPDTDEFVAWFFDVDKWLHAGTFVFLAVWFAGQYRTGSYWRIGLGLMLFGVLIEGCQRLVTYRSADWFDIAADAAGIIVGLTIAMAGVGGWSLRVEDWLQSRKADA